MFLVRKSVAEEIALWRVSATAPTPNKSPRSTAMKKHYLLMARRQHFMVQAMQSLHWHTTTKPNYYMWVQLVAVVISMDYVESIIQQLR